MSMVGSSSIKVKVNVTPSPPALVAQWRNHCAAVRMVCVAVRSKWSEVQMIIIIIIIIN